MTSAELSSEIKVPERTLDQWAYKKVGPPYLRIGRHRRYRRSDVEAWLDSQTVRPKGARHA